MKNMKNMKNMIKIKGQGPILITGPHGVYTIRNNIEIHDKEQYINKIINKLYKLLGPKRCTVMTWNKEFFEKNRIYPEDPNHIKDLKKSIWNKEMEGLKIKHPVLHIDLHGMTDNWFDHSNHLCIGTDGIKENYKCLYKQLLPKLTRIFDTLNVPYSFNNPYNGYSHNNDFYTLSHQGILNNFISLQFEISNSLRKKIAKEATTLNKFKNILIDLYSLNREILKTKKYKTCKKQQKTRKHKNSKISKKNKTYKKKTL